MVLSSAALIVSLIWFQCVLADVIVTTTAATNETNLDTSEIFAICWVRTIIHVPDNNVDVTSNEFRRTMELRLAIIYNMGMATYRKSLERNKRSATYNNATIQMISVTQFLTAADMVYYLIRNSQPLCTSAEVTILRFLLVPLNQAEAILGYQTIVPIQKYLPDEPSKLWIIGVVFGGILGLLLIAWCLAYISLKCCSRSQKTKKQSSNVKPTVSFSNVNEKRPGKNDNGENSLQTSIAALFQVLPSSNLTETGSTILTNASDEVLVNTSEGNAYLNQITEEKKRRRRKKKMDRNLGSVNLQTEVHQLELEAPKQVDGCSFVDGLVTSMTTTTEIGTDALHGETQEQHHGRHRRHQQHKHTPMFVQSQSFTNNDSSYQPSYDEYRTSDEAASIIQQLSEMYGKGGMDSKVKGNQSEIPAISFGRLPKLLLGESMMTSEIADTRSQSNSTAAVVAQGPQRASSADHTHLHVYLGAESRG